MRRKVTFVIGAPASSKITFIHNFFPDNDNIVSLNVYDYQQDAYKEAGLDKYIPFGQEFRCLYKANQTLLDDIIKALEEEKDVVVEHTLYKAKRRIAYIDAIHNVFKDVTINVYVMCPSRCAWDRYIKERKLEIKHLKSEIKEFEFPNLSEGFNKIYEVTDDDIRLRMDEPKPEIVEATRKELKDEAERVRREDEQKAKHIELLNSMNTRPFWHYCEVCGKKVFCTAQEAFEAGWDYPPTLGKFGQLFPRTCGDCCMVGTLYYKVVIKQDIPIVIEEELTEKELITWQRIKNEPESLIDEEL